MRKLVRRVNDEPEGPRRGPREMVEPAQMEFVVARPRSEAEAQIWVDVLRDEHIRAAYFPDRRAGIFGAGGDPFGVYPVVVMAAQAHVAQQVIRELGGESDLVPLPESPGGDRSLAASGIIALVTIPAVMVAVAVLSWLLS